MSDSWAQIATKLRSSNDPNAKRVLASAVGGDASASWYDLAKSASDRVATLQRQVNSLSSNNTTHRKSGSLEAGASVNLGMSPKTLIVWDNRNNMQLYEKTVWLTRNKGSSFESVWCTLDAQNGVLVNNSTEKITYESFDY